MSIEREDIMRIVSASRKADKTDDAWVMWLIFGGWALFVAVLSCLSELRQLIAGGVS